MQLRNRKIILVTIIVLIITTMAALLWIAFNPKNPNIDKPSGQEKSLPQGVEPEKFGAPDNEIVFYGLGELLSAGMRMFAVEQLRGVMYDYSSENSNYIEEVSVYKDSLIHDRESSDRALVFDILINSTDKYRVKAISATPINIRFIIQDSEGKTIIETPDMKQEIGEVYTGDGVPPEEQP